MTLVVEALSRAARQCSVEVPSSWVTASDANQVEIRDDFLLETVDDVLERIDLPSPIGGQYVVPCDGSDTYALPAAFKRLCRDDLAVYDGLLDQGCVPVSTDGEWTYLNDIGSAGVTRYYKITGYDGNYSITIYRDPNDAAAITVSYVSANWLIKSGTAGNMITDADLDTLLLPRRLVEAGIVWRFRERRGLPYADKAAEYEVLMARLANDSRARRVVTFGEVPRGRWQDMVPAFIPSS